MSLTDGRIFPQLDFLPIKH